MPNGNGSIINKKTGIAVGIVIPLLGFTVWLTTIYNTGKNNAQAIQKIRNDVIPREVLEQRLDRIDYDLAEIKALLN